MKKTYQRNKVKKSSSPGYTPLKITGVDPKSVVLKALENPKFKWRTIGGIAQETGVSEETVKNTLNQSQVYVVKSSLPSKTGEALFSTRDHLRQTQTFVEKLSAILRNRAA